MTIKILGLVTAVLSASASTYAHSQVGDESGNNFGATLKASATQTDNARKLEDTRIKELQEELQAGFFAGYENNLIQFNAKYDAYKTKYNEDSQESRGILEGDSSIRIGKERDVVDVLLTQSQKVQYSSPDDVALQENLDDRTIWSVVPTFKAQVSSVDTFALQGSYSLIDYRFNELRNSTRSGGSTYWNRRLSAAGSIRLTLGADRVEFPNGSLDNYDKRYAMLAYNAELRNLRYSLLAGMNEAIFDDGSDNYEAPMVIINAVYDAGAQKFTFSASQDVTDSSLGDGNAADVDSSPTNDGVGIDQMERQQVMLAWDTESFCALCGVNLFVQYRRDDYRRLEIENNDESSAGFSFRYQFTEKTNIELRYNWLSQQYAEATRPGFDRTDVYFGVEHQLYPELTASVFYRNELVRGDVGSRQYEENNFGVSITYSI